MAGREAVEDDTMYPQTKNLRTRMGGGEVRGGEENHNKVRYSSGLLRMCIAKTSTSERQSDRITLVIIIIIQPRLSLSLYFYSCSPLYDLLYMFVCTTCLGLW